LTIRRPSKSNSSAANEPRIRLGVIGRRNDSGAANDLAVLIVNKEAIVVHVSEPNCGLTDDVSYDGFRDSEGKFPGGVL
jgi:hypothetical protein